MFIPFSFGVIPGDEQTEAQELTINLANIRRIKWTQTLDNQPRTADQNSRSELVAQIVFDAEHSLTIRGADAERLAQVQAAFRFEYNDKGSGVIPTCLEAPGKGLTN